MRKCVQQVVGSILYYAQAVNITLLMVFGTIAAEQSKATEFTIDTVENF